MKQLFMIMILCVTLIFVTIYTVDGYRDISTNRAYTLGISGTVVSCHPSSSYERNGTTCTCTTTFKDASFCTDWLDKIRGELV